MNVNKLYDECYSIPGCDVQYGDVREVRRHTTKTHRVIHYERDVFKKLPGKKRELWRVSKWTQRNVLMLHVGGPLDGQYLPEGEIAYVTYNRSSDYRTAQTAPKTVRVWTGEFSESHV